MKATRIARRIEVLFLEVFLSNLKPTVLAFSARHSASFPGSYIHVVLVLALGLQKAALGGLPQISSCMLAGPQRPFFIRQLYELPKPTCAG
ncbi:MAG: hypothetical protein VB051_03560 [Candidatus Pelethousia sp.]|nr:hypothetical protein [Candidatus Pelethousia sp.]